MQQWQCKTSMTVSNNNYKQVRQSSGTAVYPHMPILRPHAARFHERRISSAAFGPRSLNYKQNVALTLLSLGLQARIGSYSSDFRLLGRQSSPQWEIPFPGRQWTTAQNLTPLALSSAKKSVTVQTHRKNKQ